MHKIGFFLSFLVIAVVANAQKVNGKLKFQQGQLFELALNSKTTVTQDMMGEAKVDGTAKHSYKVTNSTDDNSTLHHEAQYLAFDFSGMGQKRNFRSDNEKDMNGPIGKPIKDILQKKFDLIVDTAGKVMMVQPPDVGTAEMDDRMKLIANMLQEILDVVQPPQKGGNSFFSVLPAKEVGVGDTWNEVYENKSGKYANTYTLSAITDSTIVVDVKGTSTTVTKLEFSGMEINTNWANNSTGQIIITKSTGIVSEKSFTIESTGTSEVMGQTQTISSKTISNTRVSVL